MAMAVGRSLLHSHVQVMNATCVFTRARSKKTTVVFICTLVRGLLRGVEELPRY